MKTAIHPKYVKSTITCACGEVIETRSTVPEMRVEICSKCHPIFTGKQKLVDTEGRVDRFKSMVDTSKKLQGGKKDKKSRVRKQKASHDIKQILTQQEEDKIRRAADKKKRVDAELAKEMESVKVTKIAKAKQEAKAKKTKQAK